MADKKMEEQFGQFRDLVEHLFFEPGRGGLESEVIWYPATDAYETEDAFVVRLDLSGVQRKDVRVLLRDRVLHVRGVRRPAGGSARKTFHKMEIAMGPFARSIQVPERFAEARAEASYVDGVLEIRLLGKRPKPSVAVHIEVI